MNRTGFIFGLSTTLLGLLVSSMFVVDQRKFAVVYSFGEIKDVVDEPGLRFKLPPPFQNIIYLDRRVQTLDSPDARPIFTAEKKSLVIDWLVKWRVADPKQFIRNNGADIRLETRLSPVVQGAFNEAITRRPVQAVLATERDAVMQDVHSRLKEETKDFGIDILDVRIKRVDFSPSVTDSVYRRMESERKRVANELRANGEAEKEKIRADADREREKIIAEAYREAQIIKGAGDAEAAAVFSRAFGRDPQFAHFYRSLDAYKASFKHRSDVLVIDPNSDFFKVFRSGSSGSGKN